MEESQDPITRLLVALGYDPDAVIAMPDMGRKMRGLRIIWRSTGKEAKFYTKKQLKQLGNSPKFLQAWNDAGE